MKHILLFFLLFSFSLINLVYSQTNTVVDVVVNSADHETLEAAILAADLATTLNGEGPFTVFAPTDDAFAALPEGTLDALLADPSGDLTDILLFHVVAAKAMSTDLTDGQKVETMLGKDLTITITNDGVFINGAQVTVADVEADNGVVHVIDAVLLPPSTVADIVIESENHTTLEAALGAAALIKTLHGEGPFTVFAPTDDAFAALLSELEIGSLNEVDSATLAGILKMHVITGKVMSGNLTEGMTATTLQNEIITFSLEGGATITDPNERVSNIITTDIEADNGIVHVIDTVILPDQNATNINEIEGFGFNFYPNPAEEYIMIQSPEAGYIIKVFSITGKLMLQKELNRPLQKINVNSLNQGLYIISFEKENAIRNKKLIIR